MAPTPAAPLLALQRRAGNRAVGALLRAARRQLQRSIEDDLRAAPPAELAPTEKVEPPPGTAFWREAEGAPKWRIPMRIYAIEEVPRELDGLTMRLGLRATADSPREDRGTYTIADIRRDAARNPGERRFVAIGLHEGRLRLLGWDSFAFDERPGHLAPGLVVSDPRSGLVGTGLVVARVRLAIAAGKDAVRFGVGVAGKPVTDLHERIADAAKLRTVPRFGTGYTLYPQHMANLLAEWDRELSPEQRTALRAAGARTETRLADIAPLVVRPPVPAAQPAKPTVAAPPATAGQGERRAARGAGALVLVLLRPLLDLLKDKANDKEQRAVSQQLEAYSDAIAVHQAGTPHDGALVRISYRRTELPGASGPDKLAWVEVGYGRTESEARADLDRGTAARPGLGANERLTQREQWVEPRAPSSPTALRPPFPRAGVGGIRGTVLMLQNVKWDLDGFDDEDRAEIAVAREDDIRFSILRPPARLSGKTVPVEPRAPREGPSVPSVDLDPGTPFADVHAVPVFPDNEVTRAAFDRAPPTLLAAPLPELPNLELVRWMRPEHLRVLATPER